MKNPFEWKYGPLYSDEGDHTRRCINTPNTSDEEKDWFRQKNH